MTPLSEQKIREIEERLANAAQGDWEVGGPYPGVSVVVCIDPGCTYSPETYSMPICEPICILDSKKHGDQSKVALETANFIANSKDDIRLLLAEVKALRESCAATLEAAEYYYAVSVGFEKGNLDESEKHHQTLLAARHGKPLMKPTSNMIEKGISLKDAAAALVEAGRTKGETNGNV